MKKTIRTCDSCNKEMPVGQGIRLKGDRDGIFAEVNILRRPMKAALHGSRDLPLEQPADMCIDCFKKEFTNVLKEDNKEAR